MLFESTSVNMARAFIQPIRKAKRIFQVWVERFDQSQAPTKSNRVFGSFLFSLKVLFWQLFLK